MLKKRGLLVGMLVFVGACTCDPKPKDREPKEILTAYLERVVNVTQAKDREDLLVLTTGEIKAALLNATEAEFRRAYIQKRYDVQAFEITGESKTTPDSVMLSFYMQYRDKPQGDPNPIDVLIQNQVELVRENDRWLINRIFPGDSRLEFLKGVRITGKPVTSRQAE